MTEPQHKYLTGNPVNWLLEDSDPSIRYLVKKEIIHDPDCGNYYDSILSAPEIQRIISKNGNFFGNAIYYDIYYKGAMWCFAEAVERGLDKRTEAVRTTAAFLTSECQMTSGGFTLNWKPHTEVACRTGDMVRYLTRAGYTDEPVQRGISWIAGHQRHDGGWLHCPLAGTCDQLKLLVLNRPGNGLAREGNRQVTSCIYATIACAMALLEYRIITGSTSGDEQINNAAEFFLRRSLYKTAGNDPIKPKLNWNRDFRLLGYPVMSQYDILYGLLFIAMTGRIKDRRTGEAFNLIISKQNSDGTWNMENARTGMLYGNTARNHVGRRSKWITYRVLRLMQYTG